jgi:hypothetical protein
VVRIEPCELSQVMNAVLWLAFAYGATLWLKTSLESYWPFHKLQMVFVTRQNAFGFAPRSRQSAVHRWHGRFVSNGIDDIVAFVGEGVVVERLEF